MSSKIDVLKNKRDKAREEYVECIKYALMLFALAAVLIVADMLTDCFEKDLTSAAICIFAGATFSVLGLKALALESRIRKQIRKATRSREGGRKWVEER